MKVEILYFVGCPNHLPAVERVERVLAAEGVTAEIFHVAIPDAEAAEAVRFAGSPSVRINGVDVEGAVAGPVGMSCRTYMNGSAREGVPSFEVIQFAVRSAAVEPNENR